MIAMKTDPSFHSVTKVNTRIGILIFIASALHIFSLFYSFDTRLIETNLINNLANLKVNMLKLDYATRFEPEKIDSIVSNVETVLSPINLLKPSLFSTQAINQTNASLLTNWQQIKHEIALNDFTYIKQKVTSFPLAIDDIIKQHQILAHKKMLMMHFIELLEILFVIFIGTFLCYYSREQISSPIEKLIKNSKAIKNLQFDNHFPKPKNEVGLLSQEMEETSKITKKLVEDLQQQITTKTQQLEKANSTIEFLFSISQQLSTIKLTSPILTKALNALAEHANLHKLCLEMANGTFVDSSLGCANMHVEQLRVPIIINDKPSGFLNYVPTKGEPDHSHLIESFTGLIARTLYQQEYYLQKQKILLMEERNTIACDLHDSIAQSLSFLKIQSSLLEKQINKPQKTELQQTAKVIKETVSQAYIQLRSLLNTFRLNEKNSNFKEALIHLISDLQIQTTAVISIKQFTPDFFADNFQLPHFLHFIRESITNAIKHAQCTTIDVFCITTESNKGWISIIDNGLGIENTTKTNDSYGLSVMKRRADKLNGKFSVSSLEPGTEVKLLFPYKKMNLLKE